MVWFTGDRRTFLIDPGFLLFQQLNSRGTTAHAFAAIVLHGGVFLLSLDLLLLGLGALCARERQLLTAIAGTHQGVGGEAAV
ncbi:hypothetical protein D3C76_1628420 [compost metagenome]